MLSYEYSCVKITEDDIKSLYSLMKNNQKFRKQQTKKILDYILVLQFGKVNTK